MQDQIDEEQGRGKSVREIDIEGSQLRVRTQHGTELSRFSTEIAALVFPYAEEPYNLSESGLKRRFQMKSLIASLFLVFWSAGLSAQGTVPLKRAPIPPAKSAAKRILQPATVSGYVFALTAGGDIKPARMAKVYLFYACSAEKPASGLVEKSPTIFAADEFKRKVLNGEDNVKTSEADEPYLKDLTKCHDTLVYVYQWAIKETLHWGNDNQLITQFVFGDTDEDGRFEITIPPQDQKDMTFESTPSKTAFAPGVYLIAVSGSAGYNDAVWIDEVIVKPGETVKVKLAAPTKACLKSSSE